MIRGLNRLGVENTPTFNIQSFKEHFTGIEGDVIVKQDTTVTTDWTSIPWDSISGVALSSFLPDANSTWFLFEVTTTGFNGAGLLLTGDSSVSVNPITLELSDTVNGQVYHYSDYFIPLEELTLNGISIDNPTDVYWAIRTGEANVEDWTLFTNTWNATNILNAVNVAGVKGLHLWFYGTRNVTLDIPNVSEIEYYNHEDNIKFSEPIDDLAQEFDGVTQDDVVSSVTYKGYDTPLIFCATIDYDLSQDGALLYSDYDLDLRVQYYVVNNGTVQINLQETVAAGNGGIAIRTTQSCLKVGRNQIIIYFKGLLFGEPYQLDKVEFYVNGRKFEGGANLLGSVFTSDLTNQTFVNDFAIGNLLSAPTPLYFKGNIKQLQWLDATNLTISSTEAYSIYNSGTARSAYPNSSDYFIDFNSEGASPVDDSSNGYTITPFGGFTQTQFMD